MLKVIELWTYPIKSCAGISVSESAILHSGPQWDREWMIVNEDNRFLTQRECPKLAQVKTHFGLDYLEVRLGSDVHRINLKTGVQANPLDHISATIWKEEVRVLPVKTELNQSLSDFLGQRVRLVRYSALSQRLRSSVNPDFRPETRFTDSQPFNFFSNGSLQDLNKRLAEKGEPSRSTKNFRPNMVFSSVKPFIEDSWYRIQIGEVIFSQPKRCTRCVVTTLDPETGASQGPEPLKTLSEFRKSDGKVYFGQQMTPENEGLIRVGDEIHILT